MGIRDSTLDASALARARTLLQPPARKDPLWPALVAAVALAFTSVVFAAIMVLAPPVTTERVAKGAPS